jgi:acetyl esterase/lipase
VPAAPENRQKESFRRMVAPELRAGLETLPSFDWTDEALAQVRSFNFQQMPLPPLSDAQQRVHREERFISGPSGAPEVRVLIYRSADAARSLQPAYVHVHGGGYIMGAPEMNDASSRSIAYEQRCVVVSVDYRLAPESRYPESLEDCYAALLWVHRQAHELNVDPARIAIGGESAGGGHAAALTILARDRGEVRVCFQLLDSPMLDDRTGSTGEPHPFAGKFVWTPESNRFGWRALLGVEPGSTHVPLRAVPARTQDLAGLPATCITIGALDLFLEETLEYTRRLNRAGVPTELHVIPGAYHGFQMAGAAAPQVQLCERLRAQALQRAFEEKSSTASEAT